MKNLKNCIMCKQKSYLMFIKVVFLLLILSISGCNSMKSDQELARDLFYIYTIHDEVEANKVFESSISALRERHEKEEFNQILQGIIYRLLDLDHLPEANLILSEIQNPEFDRMLSEYIVYVEPVEEGEQNGDGNMRLPIPEGIKFFIDNGNIDVNTDKMVGILVEYNPNLVISYLKNGDVDAQYIDYIMEHGLADLDLAERLAKLNISVASSDAYQNSLDDELLRTTDPYEIKELFKKGANPNVLDETGQPHFYNLIRTASNDIYVRQLAPYIYNGVDVHYVDEEGNNLLVVAYKGQPDYGVKGTDTALDIMALLISHGANPDTFINDSSTPLTLAIHNKHYKLIDAIVKTGVSLDTFSTLNDIPLHMALDREMYDVATSLVNAGANPNLKDSNGVSSLHKVVKNNKSDELLTLVNTLLEAEADANIKDNEGFTPLHLAIERRDVMMSIALLTYGADINVKDKEGVSPAKMMADSKTFLKDVTGATKLGWEVFNAKDTMTILEIMGREDSQQVVNDLLNSSENFTDSLNNLISW